MTSGSLAFSGPARLAAVPILRPEKLHLTRVFGDGHPWVLCADEGPRVGDRRAVVGEVTARGRLAAVGLVTTRG